MSFGNGMISPRKKALPASKRSQLAPVSHQRFQQPRSEWLKWRNRFK
jgi:hypothetical protein